MLVCSIGIASCDDAVNGSRMTLFTDENTKNAEEVIKNSGIGDIFALVSTIVIIAIWVSPILLLVTALVALALHKNDLYKMAMRGFVLMALVLVAYNLYAAFIGSMTPDISSIQV